MDRPAYPGHGASQCNGCGLCCETTPCAMSIGARLWTAMGCSAHVWSDSKQRFLCDAIDHPERYGVNAPRKERMAMTDGPNRGCNFRAAFSEQQVRELVRKPNRFTPTGYPFTVWWFKPGAAPQRIRCEGPEV